MHVRRCPTAFSLAMLAALCLTACRGVHPAPDQPRLAPGTRWFDLQVPSAALGHPQPVRVIVPANGADGYPLPVVYLLHGAQSTYRDWSDKTDIATLAAHGFVLVMPETDEAFALNEVGPHRHYEDFLIGEVMPAVHRALPYAAQDRAHMAIVGISRGGLGAAVLTLHHPDRFGYVADLSAVTGLASGKFSWRHPYRSLATRLLWGPPGSPTRLANSPFLLLAGSDPSRLPYFLVTVGAEDSMRDANQRWAAALANHGVPQRFHVVPGGHNWQTWAAEVPLLSDDLRAHMPGAFDRPLSSPAAARPADSR